MIELLFFFFLSRSPAFEKNTKSWNNFTFIWKTFSLLLSILSLTKPKLECPDGNEINWVEAPLEIVKIQYERSGPSRRHYFFSNAKIFYKKGKIAEMHIDYGQYPHDPNLFLEN